MFIAVAVPIENYPLFDLTGHKDLDCHEESYNGYIREKRKKALIIDTFLIRQMSTKPGKTRQYQFKVYSRMTAYAGDFNWSTQHFIL